MWTRSFVASELPLQLAAMVDPAKDLDRAKIFNDTKWIFYCLCEGWGIGPFSPLVASDAKQLCVHGICGTVDFGGDDGLCYMVDNFLCLTRHCSFPPGQSSYPCICFNKKCGAERTSGPKSKRDGELFTIKQVFDDTFWLYYLFCYGVGINNMKGPLIQAEFKNLFCGGMNGLVAPMEDGICCSSVGTQCCIWSEFQLPPAKGNPKCAICTWKLNKDAATAGAYKASLPPQTG